MRCNVSFLSSWTRTNFSIASPFFTAQRRSQPISQYSRYISFSAHSAVSSFCLYTRNVAHRLSRRSSFKHASVLFSAAICRIPQTRNCRFFAPLTHAQKHSQTVLQKLHSKAHICFLCGMIFQCVPHAPVLAHAVPLQCLHRRTKTPRLSSDMPSDNGAIPACAAFLFAAKPP